MSVLAHVLAVGLSLNRLGFGLAYLIAPARAGEGWIGPVARDPAAQVFVRGHGARDVALGAGALATLARREPRRARDWMSAQVLADSADVAATLASRRRLPDSAFRFAFAMTSVSAGVAAVSAALLGLVGRDDNRGSG
jgi:hypothetical protein